MAVYVDSAEPDEIREALGTGFVRGVTTNPILIARTGKPPEEAVAEICELEPETLFYQPSAVGREAMKEELHRIREVTFHFSRRPLLVPKIPATWEGFALVKELAHEWTCAVTAVYSAAQAYLAMEAGARYVIPYVNRATRFGGDGLALLAEISEVLAGSGVEIIAASLKTPEETVGALVNGAHHVTVPLEVLKAMANHPLSLQAVEEFAQASRPASEGTG